MPAASYNSNWDYARPHYSSPPHSWCFQGTVVYHEFYKKNKENLILPSGKWASWWIQHSEQDHKGSRVWAISLRAPWVPPTKPWNQEKHGPAWLDGPTKGLAGKITIFRLKRKGNPNMFLLAGDCIEPKIKASYTWAVPFKLSHHQTHT